MMSFQIIYFLSLLSTIGLVIIADKTDRFDLMTYRVLSDVIVIVFVITVIVDLEARLMTFHIVSLLSFIIMTTIVAWTKSIDPMKYSISIEIVIMWFAISLIMSLLRADELMMRHKPASSLAVVMASLGSVLYYDISKAWTILALGLFGVYSSELQMAKSQITAYPFGATPRDNDTVIAAWMVTKDAEFFDLLKKSAERSRGLTQKNAIESRDSLRKQYPRWAC